MGSLVQGNKFYDHHEASNVQVYVTDDSIRTSPLPCMPCLPSARYSAVGRTNYVLKQN